MRQKCTPLINLLILTAALLAMMPLDVASKPGAAWHAKKVVVHDYTSARWRDHVRFTIEDFNAKFPKRAPRLIHREHAFHGCAGLKAKRGAIVVCEPEEDYRFFAHYHVREHTIGMVRIVLSNMPGPEAFFRSTLCHEMMHAMTDASHGSGRRPGSCVQGEMTELGAWDIAFAKKVYAKDGRDGGRGHRGKHGKR